MKQRTWSAVEMVIAGLIVALAVTMTLHTLIDGELQIPVCVRC
jgi:hypothetical protein